MNNNQQLTKYLLILLILAVVGAGVFWYVNFIKSPSKIEPITTVPVDVVVDPEEVLDEMVQDSAINYSKTFNEEDLTETYEYRMRNVEYLTDDGEYEEINNTIVASESDYQFENTTNVFKTHFKNNPQDDEAIRFQVTGNRGVSFSFIGANQADASVEENTITYPDLYEGIDVRYTVGGDLFLEEFIVQDATGVSSIENITQKLKLDSVYYKEQVDGSITFHDMGTKNIVFTAPRPVMYEVQKEEVTTLVEPPVDLEEDPELLAADLNDERIPVSYDLHYEITDDGDALVIRKVLDEAGRAWLADASFPLVADATFTYPTFGTNVNGEVWRSCNNTSCSSYTLGQNFVSDPGLKVTQVTKQWPRFASESLTGKRRTHLYFATSDLQFIPEDSIVFAQLRVSGFPYSDASLWFMPAGYSDVEVYTDPANNFTPADNMQQWFDKIGSMSSFDGVFSTSDSIPTRANWTQSYCESNPSACTHYIDINPSAAANTTVVNIGLREDAIPYEGHVNEWNWHGAKIFTTRAIDALEPVLTVTVLTKPTISIQTPLYSEYDRLDIDITDVSDNEDSWELERSLDGVSGWTNVCTATTGASGACSGGGTYSCGGTSTAGTGGICTVTNTGLIGDTLYYYRARATITSPSALSAYSSVKNDRTSAHVVNFTELVGSSPAWNEIEVTGGFNFPLVANQTDGTTKYNIIIYGNFTGSGYSERYNGDFTGTIAPIVEPFATSPHNRISVGSIPYSTWLISYFGFGGSGVVTLTGNPATLTAPYPNRDFYVGESAQDTRSPNYMHDMSIFDLIPGVFYSRARLPSKPVLGSITSSTTMRIKMDTTPYDTRGVAADAALTNPTCNDYALRECRDDNADGICNDGDSWEYFGAGACNRSATPIWLPYPQSGCGSPVWQSGDPDIGKDYGCFDAATCYVFEATSQNFSGIQGDGYDADNFSETSQFCTPLNPPDAPAVSCDYSANYNCDVTINDSLNPTPPYYYKIEESSNGTSGWSIVMDWTSHSNGDTINFVTPSCNATNTSRFYRVYAAQDVSGLGASFASANGTDTLPPCQPTGVAYDDGFLGSGKGPDYLDWTWTIPASGETIDHYALADTVSPTNSIDPAGIPTFRQSALSPNTRHIVNILACDAGNVNNGNVGRCGAKSSNSDEQYTRAAVPSYTVACNYDNALDDYYCDLDMTENGSYAAENPAGTEYLVQYCQPDNGDICFPSSVDWKNIVPLTDSGLSYPNSLGWFAKDWTTGFEDFPFEDDIFSHVTCSVGNTTQQYRIRVRNSQSPPEELGGFFSPISSTDTLPPCQPLSLGQTSHTTSSMLWGWSAPVNETQQSVQDYDVSSSSCGGDSNVPGTSYNQTTSPPNRFCAVSVRARDFVSGHLPGRAASSNGYTSIEGVSNITFSPSILTKDIIGVTAIPAGAVFSNLLTASSGVQFQETTGTAGGGGDLGFTGWQQSDSVVDRSLQTNRQYCYQARSCNGNCSTTDGTGDINSYGPATPVCQYTLADTPAPPIVARTEDGTSANVIVRLADDNPHGGGADPDTQYALCVSKYDSSDNLLFEKYARTDGTIDETGVSCASGDGSGYWATADGASSWGGVSGINIALDPSFRYDFKFKARNGDGPDIVANGCSASNCDETTFGPAATLFLVKNNIVGWSWSSHIGWISMNCLNLYNLPGFGYSCDSANSWGLNTQFETTRSINPVQGYAWSASGASIGQVGTLETLSLSESEPVKALVSDGIFMWAARSDPGVGNRLNQIDPNTMQVIASYDVIPLIDATQRDGLMRLIFDGRDLWGASNNYDRLYRFSTSGTLLESIDYCGGAVPTCNLPGDQFGLAWDGTDIWVANDSGLSVSRIRVSSVIGNTAEINCDGTAPYSGGRCTMTTPGRAHQTYFDGNNIWVNRFTNQTFDSVYRIDRATGVMTGVALGTFGGYDNVYSTGIAYDGQYWWVAHGRYNGVDYLPGAVSIIDNTDTVIATIPVSGGVSGINLRLVGLIYDGTYMWASGFWNDKIYQFDVASQTLVAEISGSNDPFIAYYDGTNFWAGGHSGPGLVKISVPRINKAGVGWISLFTNVCADDTQKGCKSNVDCGSSVCIQSAGTPPDGIGYGFCYEDATAAAKRYGVCSNSAFKCTETDVTLCTDPANETCILETCQTGDTCSDYAVGPIEECRETTTATFGGTTKLVTGWARILTLKAEGEAQGFTDWGWIQLSGQYNDGQGKAGPFNIFGTEVDSQEYLGDPDVNPNDVQLYSLIGWGWNARLTSYSKWLEPTNVSRTLKTAPNIHAQDMGKSSMVIDSFGDPHIAWSNEDATNGTRDIYYLKLSGGQWQTVTGEIYKPGVTNPLASKLNVTDTTINSIWPSLGLDSSNVPHIAWQDGGSARGGGNIYYTKWNSGTSSWATAEAIGGNGTPSLQVDSSGLPHVAYRSGSWAAAEIHYRSRNTSGVWLTVSGDSGNTNENISNTGVASMLPSLALSSDVTPRPNISWSEDTASSYEIYYRQWDGTAWVDADPLDGNPDDDVSLNPGNIQNSENNTIALNSSNEPGVVWRDDSNRNINYRTWNGTNWVTASGDTGNTDLQINIWEGADLPRYTNSEEWPGLVFDSSDQPHVVWSDDTITTSSVGEIHYRYWNDTLVAWVTASGNFTASPGAHFADLDLDVDVSPTLYSKNATLALDRFNNAHVTWNESDFSTTVCTTNTDCSDPNYPQCLYHHWDGADVYQCASTDINYSRWSPGRVQSGLGWTEFLPAGALLGVPFLETTQSDIFSSGGVQLAPPPRGSGSYTATYLILANGEIQGISGTYGRSQSGLPTSQLVEPGLNPLITDAGLPLGQNVFGDLDNDVNELVTQVGATTQNRFGHTVEKDINTGVVDISSSAVFNNAFQPILDGKVYHFTGADNYVINQQMTFTKGNGDISIPPVTTGNGLIVIDGDLEINANVLYDSTVLNVGIGDKISQLPSAAIIVRGNIYVSSFVDEISGVFVAIDNPITTTEVEGTINTSRKEPVVNTVSASASDALVYFDGGYTKDIISSTLRFGYSTLNGGTDYRTFLRWPITIPEGSEIRSAYLKLQADGNSTGNEFNARISLIDFDSANVFDFTDANFPSPYSSLYSAPTSVSVNYDTTGWNSTVNKSVDISKLVQRFIDHGQYDDAGSNYLGLMIQQGNAAAASGGANTYKQFYAWDDGVTGNEPQLVIEYSPRRTIYETAGLTDDISSWGAIDSSPFCQITSGAQCDRDAACLNIGWDQNPDLPVGHADFGSDLPNRIYYRLDTKTGNSDIPPNAEITNSELKLLAGTCNVGSANLSFQLRQGLIDQADMPVFSVNPYADILNPDVSEVAEDILAGAWVDDGTIYSLADSSRLIQAWVDMSGYLAGYEIGLRLRRNGSTESIAGIGESRPIKFGATELQVDFLAPLKVSGLFIARGYNFDRKYAKDLAPAEQIVYDGRVVANTPPGLTDFTKALPIFQRVTP